MSESKKVEKSGLATAGFVLGIIGVVLSFIPIINNAAFVLGVLSLIFGIVSLIKKAGKGKAIVATILGILSIVITLMMQSAASNAIDEAGKELDKMTGDSTEEVLKKDINVTLGDFVATTDEYGLSETKLVVKVKNITDKKKSYSIHVEAINSEGKRIDDDYVSVDNLDAGQTQDFEIFTLVDSDKIESLKKATFKIVEVSAY